MQNTKFVAIIFALLMMGSVYGLIGDYHPSDSTTATSTPINTALSSLSETGSTSTAIDYYTTQSVANSGSTSVDIPIDENSSFSTGSFASDSSWTLNSAGSVASRTQTFSGEPNYIYLTASSDTVEFDSLAFELGVNTISGTNAQDLGTVYANLTLDGYIFYWSHTFNVTETDSGYYAIFTPTYNFYGATPFYIMSDFSSASLSVVATDYNGYVFNAAAPTDLYTTTTDQGQNTVTTTDPSVDSVPLVQGYHYGTGTSTVPVPSSETAFDITWSSSVNSQVSYPVTSTTQTGTSGTITGDATNGASQSYSITTNPSDPDPSVGEYTTGYYVTSSYYLSSQVQSQAVSTTQTSSPSYTFSAVSGTTNEASSSFTFGATLP